MWNIFKKKRIVCTVDYSKRYKSGFLGMRVFAVDCMICGTTYWAKNLKQLRECVNECSNCEK